MQRHAEEEAFNAGISKGRIPLKPNYGSSFPGLTTKAIKQTVIGFPRDKIYNRSYQEAMDRPISIISYDNSDFKVRLLKFNNRRTGTFNVNYFQDTLSIGSSEAKKPNRHSTIINGNSEEKENVEKPQKEEKKKSEPRLLQNMSSGLGTTNGSKGICF